MAKSFRFDFDAEDVYEKASKNKVRRFDDSRSFDAKEETLRRKNVRKNAEKMRKMSYQY